jgi:hypothetical protein
VVGFYFITANTSSLSCEPSESVKILDQAFDLVRHLRLITLAVGGLEMVGINRWPLRCR